MSNDTNTKQTRPVNFIRFHGLNLLVMEYEGTEYVAARPLTDLAGMQWKGARKSLLAPENATLYGTREIPTPEIAGSGIASYPEKPVFCLRLDRARMFLARINTRHMKAQGNGEAADRLLALQIEWAKVLHNYETLGIAAKPGATRDLQGLIKARNTATRPGEKAALNALIDETLAAMGHAVAPDPQTDMFAAQGSATC